VQEHLAELVAASDDLEVYVCGLTEMVTDCVDELTSTHGITPERIVTEKY
jgi:NAD(P)H-flavin reductase